MKWFRVALVFLSSLSNQCLDKSLDDLITSERKPGGGSRGRRGRGGSRGGRGGGGRRQSNGESNGNYSNPLSRGDESEGDSTGPVRRERRQPRSDGPYNGRRDGDADGQWNHDRFDQRASRPSGLASSSTPAVVVGGTRLEAGTKVLVTNLDPSVGAEDIKEIFQNLGSVVKAVVFYDSERRSLGSAEVTFGNIVTATRAVEEYDGAEVDGRPMTLKLLSGVAPPPKNVVTKRRERVTQPTTAAPRREREQSYGSTREDRRDREDRGERPARRPRGASAGGRGARRGGSRGGRGGRGGRDRSDKGPAPTNDSLDKELESYQASRGGATPAAAATTATPAAATGQPE